MLEKTYLQDGEVPAPDMSFSEAQLDEVKAPFKQKLGDDWWEAVARARGRQQQQIFQQQIFKILGVGF